VVALLRPGDLQRRSARLGDAVLARLRSARLRGVREVRGRGLWWAVELEPGGLGARDLCERLARRGVLAKDAHGATVRFAPPLTIDEADLDRALDAIEGCLHDSLPRAA
jgi:ornithine--oxo-acid transaminase